MIGRFTGILLWAAAATACFGQPPPNDEFTNRTVLAGSSFTFTADTTGATFDSLNETGYYPDSGEFLENGYFQLDDLWGAPSVWWSWTPTESSTVVIESAGPLELIRACLKVYAVTNLTWDVWDKQISGIHLRFPGQFAVFQAQAGVEYQISVCSRLAKPLHFRWTTTNSPVFRLQPRTQTVSPGQSALLMASAVAAKPLRFQWLKDGVDLTGATNQLLVFHNCTFSDTAEYSLVASTPDGISTSAVVRVIVATNEVPPSFVSSALVNQTNFQFMVSGEPGRFYEVEYSNDLQTWSSQDWRRITIWNTNEITTFKELRNASARFVRLKHYHPASESCNNTLWQIRFAIWQFAESQHRDRAYSVTPTDLAKYLPGRNWPRCPASGGEYYVSTVSARPECESYYSGHRSAEQP